jgi:hypothetical protein
MGMNNQIFGLCSIMFNLWHLLTPRFNLELLDLGLKILLIRSIEFKKIISK